MNSDMFMPEQQPLRLFELDQEIGLDPQARYQRYHRRQKDLRTQCTPDNVNGCQRILATAIIENDAETIVDLCSLHGFDVNLPFTRYHFAGVKPGETPLQLAAVYLSDRAFVALVQHCAAEVNLSIVKSLIVQAGRKFRAFLTHGSPPEMAQQLFENIWDMVHVALQQMVEQRRLTSNDPQLHDRALHPLLVAIENDVLEIVPLLADYFSMNDVIVEPHGNTTVRNVLLQQVQSLRQRGQTHQAQQLENKLQQVESLINHQ